MLGTATNAATPSVALRARVSFSASDKSSPVSPPVRTRNITRPATIRIVFPMGAIAVTTNLRLAYRTAIATVPIA